MNKFERMKETSRDLVWMAKNYAISLHRPFLDKFPFVAEIDLEQWDFCITIACVYVAVTMLDNEDIPATEKEEIRNILNASLTKKYPDGVGAVNEITEFMNRMVSGPVDIGSHNALGTWVVWNFYRRKELGDDELRLVRALGRAILLTFGGCWKLDFSISA